MLLHERVELHDKIMSFLCTRLLSDPDSAPALKVHTFAVVLLHVLNALEAASIASLVSMRPISGTVPSSWVVDGSIPICYKTVSAGWRAWRLTVDCNRSALLRVHPLAINVRLRAQQ